MPLEQRRRIENGFTYDEEWERIFLMAYEKMPCLYDTEKDLHDRIGGTVCRYKGVPYWVQVESAKKINLLDIVTQKTTVAGISPSDPEFDISSAEVGYVNFKYTPEQLRYMSVKDKRNKVYYLERIPFRRFRQGLCGDSMTTYSVEGDPGIPAASVLASQGFLESQINCWPSIPTVLSIFERGLEKEIAVSVDTALQRIESGLVLVFHRTKNIGWITPGRRSFEIELAKSPHKWVYERVLKKFMVDHA